MRDPLVLRYAGPVDGRIERQVRGILRAGWRAQTFSGALLAPAHDRILAVTFDGHPGPGAVAALERLGVPATLFGPGPHPTGWERGALPTGGPLTRLDDAALAALLASERAGGAIALAYPGGAVDERVLQAAADAGFRTAATVMPLRRTDRRPSSRLRWGRLAISAGDGPLRWRARVLKAVIEASGQAAARPDALVLRPARGAGDRPRVAVVIPCFEDGELARGAVASIREAEPVEVIVVDDASGDPATAQALAALADAGVPVVRQPENAGPSAARRAGLAATTAPYVFPLDADDELTPGALGVLADRLDADPGLAAAWGDVVTFGRHDERGTTPVWLDPFRVAQRNEYNVASLFRRSTLEAVGAWRDVGGAVAYEDWALWMTLAERGERGAHVGPGIFTSYYRLHAPRRLADASERHRAIYAAMQAAHPRLFAELPGHRRRSDLPWLWKRTWPLLFGGRPPLGLRRRAEALIPGLGRWTA